jgi:hypothetical protein
MIKKNNNFIFKVIFINLNKGLIIKVILVVVFAIPGLALAVSGRVHAQAKSRF